jgi:tryptophanyl-tRNA synthetase
MDLQQPTAKMSKSTSAPNGIVYLLDEPDAIRRKVRSAVTDSGREVLARPDKPAITNLLELFSAATGQKVGELEEAYAGRGYGDFKRDLAEALVTWLTPIRQRYAELRQDPAALRAVLDHGAERAGTLARQTLPVVRERMGFLPGRGATG